MFDLFGRVSRLMSWCLVKSLQKARHAQNRRPFMAIPDAGTVRRIKCFRHEKCLLHTEMKGANPRSPQGRDRWLVGPSIGNAPPTCYWKNSRCDFPQQSLESMIDSVGLFPIIEYSLAQWTCFNLNPKTCNVAKPGSNPATCPAGTTQVY